MINKIKLQSIINKYYLGLNESIKWGIKDNVLDIDFTTPTKDVIGKITCNNFELEDSELFIYDTKKLQNLISICSGDLLIELEYQHKVVNKIKLSDPSFNLTYALSDSLLIGKVGTVNIPEWVVEINLEVEDVNNLVKAKSALTDVDNMMVIPTKDIDENDVCKFIFGDEEGHNNKITYQILGDIKKFDFKLPFNSDMFKTILQANKDMETGVLYLSDLGLMGLKFTVGDITSEYYMIRKAETSF